MRYRVAFLGYATRDTCEDRQHVGVSVTFIMWPETALHRTLFGKCSKKLSPLFSDPNIPASYPSVRDVHSTR